MTQYGMTNTHRSTSDLRDDIPKAVFDVRHEKQKRVTTTGKEARC